ncbi:glutathione peroxidase [Paraferrimonas sedimenticola]|uniref:Glutathione peroxidase n=1 Tax=Paraferrimonas sedimenticola TaxID=375674 RepID=A0AA37VV31_9GAMM|nr:glutathione peroxidase [Paraferrimonas sedimenticola]GLP96009.1 glutathione peroxidase [Paraferrimonas sedimenticola]
MDIYQHQLTMNDGSTLDLSELKGKVLLIVNTASKCGFTPQYQSLQALHKHYADKGLVVIGAPCNQFGKQEPGNAEEINSFCELNYGVNFPLTEKLDVKGDNAHPLFKHLTKAQGGWFGSNIKWNFTKFLVDKQGQVFSRHGPTTDPVKLKQEIEHLLA